MGRYTKYKHIAIKDFIGEPTAEEIAAIEAMIGRMLPQSFKSFLMVANGGFIDFFYINYPPPYKNTGFPFGYFLNTRMTPTPAKPYLDTTTFLFMTAELREKSKIPQNFLPFSDSNENFLFLDLREDGSERVIAACCGIETPEQGTELVQMNYSSITEIAPSFDDFIDKLYLSGGRNQARYRLEQARRQGNKQELESVHNWLDIVIPDWRTSFWAEKLWRHLSHLWTSLFR